VNIDALFVLDNRQLKHQCTLPFRQHIQQNRLSVREREGIMVLIRRARFNLAKSGDTKASAPG
jgi:hypothetical protein